MGPRRLSFERIEEEMGSVSASCKANFRFHLKHLRRLHRALHLPEEIHTGCESVDSEEALLILLKRMSYPGTLASSRGHG